VRERVLEGVFQIREQPRLVDELGGLQVVEPTPERVLRQLGDCLEQCERHVFADDGGDLEEAFVPCYAALRMQESVKRHAEGVRRETVNQVMGDGIMALFELVAAANPCRRGCASFATCASSPGERARYSDVSLDHSWTGIDLHLDIPALPVAQLADGSSGAGRARTSSQALSPSSARTPTGDQLAEPRSSSHPTCAAL